MRVTPSTHKPQFSCVCLLLNSPHGSVYAQIVAKAKLGFRKLNLSWQLFLEVLSLLRIK